MSESQSPVQPLESTGGNTDQRLANLVAGATGGAITPEAAAVATALPKAPADQCPNCLYGAGKETTLENGKCPTCGFDTEA